MLTFNRQWVLAGLRQVTNCVKFIKILRLNLISQSCSNWISCVKNSRWKVALLGAVRDSIVFLIDFDHPDFIQIRFPTAAIFMLLFQQPFANT